MTDIDISMQVNLLKGLELDLIDTIDNSIEELGDRPDKVQEITDDCLNRILAEVSSFRDETSFGCNAGIGPQDTFGTELLKTYEQFRKCEHTNRESDETLVYAAEFKVLAELFIKIFGKATYNEVMENFQNNSKNS